MKVIDVKLSLKSGVLEAVEVLKRGGVLVYPTDTLYGFGVDAKNREAVRRLREIKGRSRGLVFSVMLPDIQELTSLVTVDIRFVDALKVLPGPYTFIFPSKVRLPDGVIGKGLGLGVRVPDHPVALGIAVKFGGPVITTSVNRTGESPMTRPADIMRCFSDVVDLLLDDGPIVGKASTVISFMTRPPEIVREGSGPVEFLDSMK